MDKYFNLIEHAADGVAILQDGVFKSVNDALTRMSGYSRQELLGMSFIDLITPGFQDSVMMRYRDRSDSGEADTIYETKALTKDGEMWDIEVNAALTEYEGRVADEVIIRDITERKRVEEQLHQSQEFSASLLNNSPYPMLAVNPDSSIRYVNPALEKLTGFSSAELIGRKPSYPWWPRETRRQLSDNLKRAMKKGVKQLERVFQKKNGEYFEVEINSILVGEEKKPQYYLSTWLDITKRKQAENLFKTLAQNSPVGVYIVQGGKFRYVNPVFQGFTGYSEDELLGRDSLDIVVAEDRNMVRENAVKMLKGKLSSSYQFRVVYKGGDTRWVMESVTSIQYRGSRATLSSFMDITERRLMEQKIKQAAEEWRETFDSITDLISIVDNNFKIVRVNKAFANYFKINLQDVIRRNCYEVMHGTKEPPLNCPHRRTLQARKPFVERYFEPHLGTHLEVSTSPILNNKGEVLASVHITKDITDRKKAEEREKQLQEELILTSRLASIGEMASGVAHEINNPLTSIIGFSQLIMDQDIPSTIRDDLQVINSEAERVAKIVSGLLVFAHQHGSSQECVDINECVSRIMESRSYEMKVHNIRVVDELAPDLPSIPADASQLQQVFLNIIINAEKEMMRAHGEGELLVKTEGTANCIRISFTDDGPGISKENMSRIFDPFFTTRETGDGTGLGLSVCHGIVHAHKGRIYAESERGKGATFIVELPIVVSNEESGSTEVAEESWHHNQAKILVVDDERFILNFLDRLLTEQGYEVETVDRAGAALEKIGREEYDLILTDIKMPDMNGIELYHNIKKADTTLARRVVFITGDIMETTTMDFLKNVGARYIVKPFNIEQIKREINSVLTDDLVGQLSQEE